MTTIEAKAKQRLKNKLYQITIKYSKLVESTKSNLEEKKYKDIKKAERQNKQRIIDQEKKEKNKVRKKEWKPLLKVKVKKVNRVKKCDDLFSLYIRKKYWERCFTCPKGKGDNNWHCFSRIYRLIRRDEDNCRPQGYFCCNSKATGNGRHDQFKANLARDWVSVQRLQNVVDLAIISPRDHNKKPTDQKLQEIFKSIKEKYDSLQ